LMMTANCCPSAVAVAMVMRAACASLAMAGRGCEPC
jgi:hypothetical protein